MQVSNLKKDYLQDKEPTLTWSKKSRNISLKPKFDHWWLDAPVVHHNRRFLFLREKIIEHFIYYYYGGASLALRYIFSFAEAYILKHNWGV